MNTNINTISFNDYNPLGIVNYAYEPFSEEMKTTLTFTDGTSTSVTAPIKIANQYVGFYICVAKHFTGGDNTINDEADYWIKKRPKIAERIIKASE